MKILDENFVARQLSEWAKEDYPLTISQEVKAKELFYELMTEKQNATKQPEVQEALLAEIARKLSYGETPEGVFRQHGDNKHLYYFDVFLKEGEAQNVQDALKANGLSTDVLKGIKKSVPFDVTTGNVRVVQVLSEPPPTPVVIRFEIYVGNRLIYKWTPDEYYTYSNNYDEDYEPEEEVQPVRTTKSGNKILKIVVTPVETKTYEEIQYKTGRTAIVARGAGGRFTKK